MSNIFDKILSFNVGGQGKSVAGIDIGSSAIKIVQIKKDKGKAVLENYGELSLGPSAGLEVGRATNLPQEKILGAIKDLLQETKINATYGAISIPLSASLLSIIEMPRLDKKKLEAMIPLEARKYIPVPISEVLLDWWVMPERNSDLEETNEKSDQGNATEGKKTLEVLIAAIHNEAINKYQALKTGAGISNALFEVEIFSTIRAVIGHDLAPIMILDMGAGSTKLAMIEYGVIRNSPHIINMGSQDITLALSKSLGIPVTEAEQLKREVGLSTKMVNGKNVNDIISLVLDNIFGEAKRVLINYQKRYNKTVSKIVMTGGGVLLKGLPAIATKNFESEVMLGDPFAKVEAPAFLGSTLRENGPEFAVAIGLALKAMREDE
ncbi:MAG: type IV pilus assembly protein PilM [bacterium]|nr:type IV pilus assembly protein PilM [bacterium]